MRLRLDMKCVIRVTVRGLSRVDPWVERDMGLEREKRRWVGVGMGW